MTGMNDLREATCAGEPIDPADADDCTVVELLDRLLHKGVVLGGDLTISVADIDLVYLRLQAALCSVETSCQAGWVEPAPQRKDEG